MVADVVRRQRDIGIDVVNEGEFTKGGDWLSFVGRPLRGFEERPLAADDPLIARAGPRGIRGVLRLRDRARDALLSAGRADSGSRATVLGVHGAGRVLRGRARRARDRARLRAAGTGQDAFLTSTAPVSLEVYRRNDYYQTEEVRLRHRRGDAGRVRRSSTPGSSSRWTTPGCRAVGPHRHADGPARRFAMLHRAGRGAESCAARPPEEQIRYHLCWGSWHGPHAYDLELRQLVDIMLRSTRGPT